MPTTTTGEGDAAVVRFVAALAAVMHPIKTGRDGARIAFDVPLSERLEVMKLELMTDMAFEVTIRPVVQPPTGATEAPTVRRWNERKH